MSLQQQQTLLAAHPSVQDLNMNTFQLNPRKAHYHNLLINSGPLHAPSEHGKGSVAAKAVPKGQTVKVVKCDANLQRAAQARLIPSEVAAPLPLQSATSASGKPAPKSTVTSSSSAIKDVVPSVQSGLPPVGAAAAHPKQRRPTSIVSSQISYQASDAESFSVYSCSCCHVKPPSSCGVGGRPGSSASSVVASVHPSDYDNMTSVSQRPSNHPSRTTSVNTTKLKHLEDELFKERTDRLKTQEELDNIKKRQQFLLSKLSKEEREQLKLLMGDA